MLHILTKGALHLAAITSHILLPTVTNHSAIGQRAFQQSIAIIKQSCAESVIDCTDAKLLEAKATAVQKTLPYKAILHSSVVTSLKG